MCPGGGPPVHPCGTTEGLCGRGTASGCFPGLWAQWEKSEGSTGLCRPGGLLPLWASPLCLPSRVLLARAAVTHRRLWKPPGQGLDEFRRLHFALPPLPSWESWLRTAEHVANRLAPRAAQAGHRALLGRQWGAHDGGKRRAQQETAEPVPKPGLRLETEWQRAGTPSQSWPSQVQGFLWEASLSWENALCTTALGSSLKKQDGTLGTQKVQTAAEGSPVIQGDRKAQPRCSGRGWSQTHQGKSEILFALEGKTQGWRRLWAQTPLFHPAVHALSKCHCWQKTHGLPFPFGSPEP